VSEEAFNEKMDQFFSSTGKESNDSFLLSGSRDAFFTPIGIEPRCVSEEAFNEKMDQFFSGTGKESNDSFLLSGSRNAFFTPIGITKEEITPFGLSNENDTDMSQIKNRHFSLNI
jgi:hypothetical protein